MPTGPYRQRIGREYRLPAKLASLLALLVVHDVVSNKLVHDALGDIDHRASLYRLRQALKKGGHDIVIHTQPTIGWWLDEDVRRRIAIKLRIILIDSELQSAAEVA